MVNFNFEISPIIKELLDNEIENGNKVSELNKGWPNEESILIILEKPFSKKYLYNNLEYCFVNDPHYWKEEYEDKKYMQTIACKF